MGEKLRKKCIILFLIYVFLVVVSLKFDILIGNISLLNIRRIYIYGVLFYLFGMLMRKMTQKKMGRLKKIIKFSLSAVAFMILCGFLYLLGENLCGNVCYTLVEVSWGTMDRKIFAREYQIMYAWRKGELYEEIFPGVLKYIEDSNYHAYGGYPIYDGEYQAVYDFQEDVLRIHYLIGADHNCDPEIYGDLEVSFAR